MMRLLATALAVLPWLFAPAAAAQATPAGAPAEAARRTAPAWIRGAVCYQVFVRSFQDSDGDGIGDLPGLIRRLDYLNDGDPRTSRDLGVRCLWLMPVMESPSYHGYDVRDFFRVDRDYGTDADFKRLVAEAHRRGIRVLVDMVPNHVSSEHPAFQAALRDTASPFRAWFRFAPEKGPKNRWGGDNWHKSPVRHEYYYGFFWQGMPDLNYGHPAVLEEMKRIASFWLDSMGVDGFRLDAVKFLVEEDGRADDTPGTHGVLADYAAHVKRVNPQAFTIGEVFDSTGALLPYYPDQLDGYFAFEVADSILAAVRGGRGQGLLAPVLRLQERLPAWRWSPFLRNHDQSRTMTELGGDWKKAGLAATILLTLPGFPFVYYGEELGMTGPKPDERIRTPMGWTTGGPHAGFTSGRPWQPLSADSLVANVAAQDRDPESLLNHYRRLIRLRGTHAALAAGRVEPLEANNDAVVAYVRRAGNRAVLVVANLGESIASGVTLRSPARAGTLPPGTWRGRDLLGPRRLLPLRVGRDGQVRDYTPLDVLAPKTAYLFDLTGS